MQKAKMEWYPYYRRTEEELYREIENNRYMDLMINRLEDDPNDYEAQQFLAGEL